MLRKASAMTKLLTTNYLLLLLTHYSLPTTDYLLQASAMTKHVEYAEAPLTRVSLLVVLGVVKE